MEFRQLQLFVAVAEELHFGRAAARVGMAQPPFSQQIRRLEAALGLRLLTRTSRRVALTSAGERFLDDARALLAKRAEVITAARRAAGGEVGVLRVGFGATSAFGVLPDIVRRFRSQLPDVTLQLHERESTEIGAALATGDLDIAIVRGPFKHEGVTAELLVREPLALALPSTHGRAREKAIALSTLAAEPFVLFPRHTAPGLHDAVIRMCVAAGFSPAVVQEAPSWSSVVCLVAAGLGITIAPLSAGDLRPRTVVFRELRGASGWAELAIAFKKQELSPVAAHFRAIAHAGSPRSGSPPAVSKRGRAAHEEGDDPVRATVSMAFRSKSA